MSKRFLIVAVVALAAVAAACGGSSKAGVSVSDTVFEASTTSTTAKVDTEAAVSAYVRGITALDPEGAQEAIEASAPGSPAGIYAAYLQATAQLTRDAGRNSAGVTVEITDGDNGSQRFCYTAGTESKCYTASDFQLDANGKVVDVSINGTPLAGRIVGPGDPVSMPGGGTAQRMYVFQTSDNQDLLAIVNFTATDESLRVPYGASYVTPAGSQVDADTLNSTIPLNEVLPSAKRLAEYVFPKAAPGGRMVFQDVCNQSYNDCRDVTIALG
jgi:hypothetical protein